MNGNRSRYTQTPTFGMQKRSLFNKTGLFQKSEQSAPDFTKAPPQAEIPNPAFFATPVHNPLYGDPAQMPASPYGMQPPQPMQGYTPAPSMPAPGYPGQGGYPPYALDSGVPPMPVGGVSLPDPTLPMGAPQGGYSGNLPPLGNSAQNMNGGFSARNQGFVPPQQPQSTELAAPVVTAISAPPDIQPAGYGPGGITYPPSGMPMPGQPAYQAPQNAFYPQQNVPPAAQPYQQPPMNGGQSSFMQMAARNHGGQYASASAPADANMLWMLFLFGLIPLLFIPCLFVSQTMNVLRYIFLAVCLIGLGAMWYRQMMTPAARIIVSVIYVGMCIFTLSMAMEGKNEVQLAPNVTPPPPASQLENTPEPSDYDYAAAAGLSAPVEEPTPTPAAKSEAETRLEMFMNNWCGNRVEDMVSLVQPSWASAQESPVTALFTLLTNRLPISYTLEDISGTDDDTSRTITMTAEIDKQNGKDPVIYRFTVLMVKEGGQWYVNPNSLATNDEVNTEEVVVNDKTSNITTTEAPRTTVSPAPPAETTLYYNPDGGHYYHMDANCESIREEFRPLTGTFLYRDLREYSSLSPCLKCGAPTTALPNQ